MITNGIFNTRRKVCASGLAMAVALANPSCFADVLPSQKVNYEVRKVLDTEYPQLDRVYKDLHANPELGFHETRTAAVLAREMRALGFEVTEKVGGTGIVAILTNGAGPTAMVRTELDALPMEEKTGLPYASRVKTTYEGLETFVAHSCGHDIHMAIWLGTAKVLSTERNHWRGTLMFIAQPAEEVTGGAKAMIADGLFVRSPKPNVGFALHVGPDPVGTLAFKSGPITSTADILDTTFLGKGGHGSAPSITIDPVLMASRFVVDVQSVVSREKLASAFGVVTIGSIHGGTSGTLFPTEQL